MANDLKCHKITWTYPRRVEKTFLEDLPVINEGRVLDWRCSEGITTRELATRHYRDSRVVGIDVDEKLIETARAFNADLIRAGRVDFRQANGYRLLDHFQSREFDGIFVMNNLVYVVTDLSDEDLERILRGINCCLDHGGYLAFSAEDNYLVLQKDGMRLETVGEYTNPNLNPVNSMAMRGFGRMRRMLEKISL